MTHPEVEESSDRAGRAVSPVIAVILMVAITVIIAAVVGIYGLGFGSETSQDAPQVAWDHEQYFDDATGDLTRLEIVHQNGAALDMDEIEVLVEGTEAAAAANVTFDAPSDTMTTPNSFTFNFTSGAGYSAGDTIRIVWHPPDSTETRVIHAYDLERDTV